MFYIKLLFQLNNKIKRLVTTRTLTPKAKIIFLTTSYLIKENKELHLLS